MAAGDFTASVRNDLQIAMETFAMSGPTEYELNYQVESIKTMLDKMQINPQPIMVGNECIGFDVHWIKSGDDTLNYNGTAQQGEGYLEQTCDLATGIEAESDSETYSDNVRIISVVDIDDNLCNNTIEFANLVNWNLRKAMHRIRKALNVRAVNFFNSNAQVCLDTEVANIDNGNGAWAVNADTITIELPTADAKDPDALALVDTVILNNNFAGEYFLLSGRFNWYQQVYNANFRNLNDNERNQLATYQAHNMYFDIRDLDSTLTGKNTFAVDPWAYTMWNRFYSSGTEPTQRDSDVGALWEFYLEDPILQIKQPDGTMAPLRYEVVYQRVCQGRNANTRHTDIHRFEVKFLGGLALAPAGADGETGILKFKAVDAV